MHFHNLTPFPQMYSVEAKLGLLFQNTKKILHNICKKLKLNAIFYNFPLDRGGRPRLFCQTLFIEQSLINTRFYVEQDAVILHKEF